MHIEMDIIYYEYMINLEYENQRINEAIMAPKFAKYLSESKEEVFIYENSTTESFLGFIKKIFEKVLEFFKKLTNRLTSNLSIAADKKLISMCKQKLKNMSDEEKETFRIEKIDIGPTINTILTDVNEDFLSVNTNLLKVMDSMDNFLTRAAFSAALEPIKENIKLYTEQLDEKTDVSKIEKEDVDFKVIESIVDQYDRYKDFFEEQKKNIKDSETDLKECKRRIDRLIRVNIVENLASDILQQYKDVIYSAAAYLMKAQQIQLNLIMMSVKNKEAILKKFAFGN